MPVIISPVLDSNLLRYERWRKLSFEQVANVKQYNNLLNDKTTYYSMF
jgi:hypothetical protein